MLKIENFDEHVLNVLNDVFDNVFGQNWDNSKLKINRRSYKKFDNAVLIGIFGDIEGICLLEFHNKTVENIANKIFGQRKEKLDYQELVKGVFGEIANILTSKLIPKTDKRFGNTNLSTPSLFRGSGIQVDLFYQLSHNVCVTTEFGILKITFAIKK